MIKEINLNNIATFTQPVTITPMKINFFYGSNGSGKTTISNVIADCQQYGAMIAWNNTPLQTLVYNRSFVENNFGETANIGGIFTLGKDSKEAQTFIAEHHEEANKCSERIEGYRKAKEILLTQQRDRETEIDNYCWNIKLLYDKDFLEAFSGLNSSKNKFRERCLAEAKNASQIQRDAEEVKKLYHIAFRKTHSIYPLYALININQIVNQEKCELLAQKISGSADTPIGKFIEFLGNSDWIKQGLPFAERAEGKCPFCQQKLPHDIYDNIEAFFDDSYERDLTQLKSFGRGYSQMANNILLQLRGYISNPLPILDYSLFKADIEALALLIDKNVKTIESKINTPSAGVVIDSLSSVLGQINVIIEGFNRDIAESNEFATNQKTKQKECIKDVWQLVIYRLQNEIDTYNRDTKGNQEGIERLDELIKTQSDQQREHSRLISEREKAITTVKPTAEAINAILSRFGFEGFSITENPSERGTYKIVRSDGRCVNKTLSEGEYNFISFLYFYHLIYGSQDATGIAKQKVVVIDDPISSLDSNVLFIVSTLVRQIVDDCKNNKKGIKQVFVLTHNVYFHKEITYLGSRAVPKKDEVAFWIVKKNNNITQVVNYMEKNPIQTSYQLLWSELKDAESFPKITIFNTLRRILEYYFNVIGGLNYEKCINEFDGEDKLICKSLISCINEGSHFITDDFVMQYESESISNYMRVFKLIFVKMNHECHYTMMMRGLESA